jgi:hypothetical protein
MARISAEQGRAELARMQLDQLEGISVTQIIDRANKDLADIGGVTSPDQLRTALRRAATELVHEQMSASFPESKVKASIERPDLLAVECRAASDLAARGVTEPNYEELSAAYASAERSLR